LHVVIVDEELPYPPNTGKRLRTFNLVSRLARRHRLTYICHRNADPDEAHSAAQKFRELEIEPIVVDRAVPPKSGKRFYFRLAANLVSPLPYSVAIHRSAALRQAIQAYAANHSVDLWHCEWTPYAAALQGLKNVHRLVMAHNVESLIWQRYYETERSTVKRWYIGKQWRKFERFEREAFADAEQVVAVSAEDAERIERDFGAAHVAVVDNGVDTAYFQPQPGRREANRILFLGSLEWRPNLDAVDQLLDRIFPTVHVIEATARLSIVGRNPAPALRDRVIGRMGVHLHANVADVRPFLAQSAVLAVPLRIGGGSRLKILEALASGVPVVSTRVGAEGLCLEPDRHLTVVDDIDDMAPALVRTLRNPAEALAQAERGRQRVLERYDWSLLADKLEEVWIACATGAQPGRVQA
jgi:glycosyltransferase involved in cell wall biosynthesis